MRHGKGVRHLLRYLQGIQDLRLALVECADARYPNNTTSRKGMYLRIEA